MHTYTHTLYVCIHACCMHAFSLSLSLSLSLSHIHGAQVKVLTREGTALADQHFKPLDEMVFIIYYPPYSIYICVCIYSLP